MLGIAAPQPKDEYGQQVMPEQASSKAPAYATNVSGALLSSMVALDNRATVLEVVTGNGPAGIKWWGSVIGSANIHPSMTAVNFDNAIPANSIRRFVIPQSVISAGWGSVIGGRGAQNGLYPQVTVIPLQTALPTSIFTSQF